MDEDIEQEMEDVDYLVCACAAGLEGCLIEGDLMGECCQCGMPIIYRSNMAVKPKKICMKCAVDMMTLDAH